LLWSYVLFLTEWKNISNIWNEGVQPLIKCNFTIFSEDIDHEVKATFGGSIIPDPVTSGKRIMSWRKDILHVFHFIETKSGLTFS